MPFAAPGALKKKPRSAASPSRSCAHCRHADVMRLGEMCYKRSASPVTRICDERDLHSCKAVLYMRDYEPVFGCVNCVGESESLDHFVAAQAG